MKRLLEDPVFVERDKLKTYRKPRTGDRLPMESAYFPSAKDFCCMPDGAPYPENHPEIFTQSGGGRLKLSAYLRLDGDDKQVPADASPEEGDRWTHLPEWACDDEGRPMTLEDINRVIASWGFRSSRGVTWADKQTGSAVDWQKWANSW